MKVRHLLNFWLIKEPYFAFLSFYLNRNEEEMCRSVTSLFVMRVSTIWENEPDELLDYNSEFFLGFVRIMINGGLWAECIFLLEIALCRIFIFFFELFKNI